MTFKSKHLAVQELCRMYDRGDISFEIWLACPVIETSSGWVIEAFCTK